MKTLSKVLILVLCLTALCPILSSCGEKNVFELGPYSITKEEYSYLLGMYKKKILTSMGYTEEHIDYEISEGVTLGEYLESMYRAEFDQTVYTLLYSQALFDEYNLSFSHEQESTIRATADAIIYYFGNMNEASFNALAEPYGFNADTIRSIYYKQAKESEVIRHLYGQNYSNLSENDKEAFYKGNYMHFQVLIVNTLYKKYTDSNGVVSYVNLTEDEREYYLRLEKELKELLVNENKDYSYLILKDDINLSYDELWAKYSDDTVYPQGYYMRIPSASQMQSSNTLSAAFLLSVGDCASVTAKKYFDGDGVIYTKDGAEEIHKGDYFEYGTAIVKKLDLDSGAYAREENKDFFPKETFLQTATQSTYFNHLKAYEQSTFYTLLYSASLQESYSFENTLANEIDYEYLYGK